MDHVNRSFIPPDAVNRCGTSVAVVSPAGTTVDRGLLDTSVVIALDTLRPEQLPDRKPRGARAVDLMIAAVAMANDLPLFTCNPTDFDHLGEIGLDVHAV